MPLLLAPLLLLLTAFPIASHADTVRIGATLPLSGTQAQSGQDVLAYLKASVEAINEGGLAGPHRLELTIVDDGYEPARSAANTDTMIQGDGAVLIVNAIGTANISAMLNPLKRHGVALWAPLSGPQVVYRPDSAAQVVAFRASYHDEIRQQAVLLERMGASSVALVYTDDGFGADVLAGWEKYLASNPGSALKLAGRFAVPRGSENIAAATQAALASRPSAIALGLVAAPAIKAVEAIRSANVAGLYVTMLSVSATSPVIARVREIGGSGILFSSVTRPAASVRGLAIGRDFERMRERARLQDSWRGFEAYLSMRVLAEVMRKLPERGVRAEVLASALRAVPEVQVGGESFRFNREPRFADVIYIGKSGFVF